MSKKIKIDIPLKINDIDLADLCSITEEAIKVGGGFGWLKSPPQEVLKKYWRGVLLVPHRKLILGRLNGVVAGTLQLVFQPPNNEAQQCIAQIFSHFVAPWARGFGIAKSMIDSAENEALEFGAEFIQLDVRESQKAAIKLFESKKYKKWGVNPHYAVIDGKNLRGFYYYKKIK